MRSEFDAAEEVSVIVISQLEYIIIRIRIRVCSSPLTPRKPTITILEPKYRDCAYQDV